MSTYFLMINNAKISFVAEGMLKLHWKQVICLVQMGKNVIVLYLFSDSERMQKNPKLYFKMNKNVHFNLIFNYN